MAGEWEQTTLGEHVELATGPAFKSAEFSNSGVRLARGDNVKEGFFQWGEKERFWPSLTADLEKFLLQSGDVLLGMDGSKVGKNWVQVREKDVPCLLVQRVARIRAKKTLDQSLLPYLLGTFIFREYVDRVRTGTSIPHISGGQIREFPIPLPPLPEQKAIAHVLGSLDDKIELNRRMNETLEGMAQALFKSWFVDFDPVIDNALAAGNLIPEPFAQRAETRRQAIANGSANRESAQAFLASFRFTEELGWIPEGWDECNLESLATPKKGKNITKKTIVEGKVPVVAGGLQPAYFHNTPNVLGPVITVSASGANAGFVNLYHENIWASDCSYISSKETDFVYSTFLFLRSRQDRITDMQQGAAQPHVYPKDLLRLKYANPPKELWSILESIVEASFNKIAENKLETQTLAKLRDVLLPKLISGELRIPQAEKMVEEAIA
jgi:type I restriction enzyme S subunit